MDASNTSTVTEAIDEGITAFMYFNVATFVISVFGVGANAINIVVFVRLGFKETINISLFSLAISDLFTEIMLLWCTIFVNPWQEKMNWPLMTIDFWNVGTWVLYALTRNCCWVAVFITVERCLCITMPLKVKAIVTRKVTVTVILAIFVVSIANVVPVFITMKVAWDTDSETNTTKLRIIVQDDYSLLSVTHFVGTCVRLLSFFCLLVSTVILVVAMQRKTKWRNEMASVSSDKLKTLSARDSKVVSMVIAIASVILITYSLDVIQATRTALEPDFEGQNKQSENTHRSFWYLSLFLYSCNSSVNIIFYYKMSSKFKNSFFELLGTQRIQQ